MTKETHLIRIKNEEELRNAGILFKPNTLYQYHSTGKYPEIFVKIGSMLCIDLDKWREFIQKEKRKSTEQKRKMRIANA
jgi:hypothetical protein